MCGASVDGTLVDGLCSNCHATHGPTLVPSTIDLSDPALHSPVVGASPRGKEFGEYELIEEVARGGMGVIYKARHKKLNRVTAIKMILSGRFSSSAQLQRFHIEAEAAAKLDHPNIVPVYEIGDVDGQAFFAMKFIDGGSLADQIEKYRSQPREAMTLLATVVRAVHHAHQRGVLHRDLKPANILVDQSGEPLITDLGLAKTTGGSSKLTNTGAVLGTPSYMPPEQASGSPVITTAADVYSLGAIMYELLTGEPPHQGDNPIEIVMKVMEGPPEVPHKKFADVDRDLELICMKCLEHNPNDRYESAAELAKDLESWLAGESISLKAPSILARTGRWFRQNRRLAYVGFAVLMGIIVSVPFALELATGDQFTKVYKHFPDDQRPVLYRWSVPNSVGAVFAFLLVVVLWPSVGWLNALVVRPKTKWHAVKSGIATSMLLVAVFTVLLGWMIVARTVATGESKQSIRTLAEAVWVPRGKAQANTSESANTLYPGLDKVPKSDRARVVTDRIVSDQIATGPIAVVGFLFVVLIVSVPIIYGTVYGYVLLGRGNWFWVSYIRHAITWWTTSFAVVLCLALLSGNEVNGANGPVPRKAVVWLASISAVIAWLTIRQWRGRGAKENSTPTLPCET